MADPNEELAGAGAGKEELQEKTPGSSLVESTLPESFEDILQQGLRVEREEEPEGDEDETGEEETPPAAPEHPAPKSVAEWASEIAQQPQRLSEIPLKQQPEVIKTMLDAERTIAVRAINQAVAEARTQARAEFDQELKVRDAVAEIDGLRADDPEGFSTWAEEFPERAEAYYAYKRQGKAPAGSMDAGKLAQQAIVTAAAPLMKQLESVPNGMAAIQERERREPGRYAPTPDGLANLSADVAEVIASERVAKKTADDEPARKALEKRQLAATARESVPKPDVSEGRKPAPVLSDDPRELITQGWHEDMVAARR